MLVYVVPFLTKIKKGNNKAYQIIFTLPRMEIISRSAYEIFKTRSNIPSYHQVRLYMSRKRVIGRAIRSYHARIVKLFQKS